MPLTKEDKRRILASNGYDPNDHYLDESTGDVYQGTDPSIDLAPEPATPTLVPTSTSKSTTFGAVRRGATQSLFPSLAAIGGGAVAAQALPFAHVAPPYSEIAAGLGGALATGFGAAKLQEAVVPESVKEAAFLRPEDIAEHPIASTVGELAPNAIAFNPIKSIGALGRGIKGLGTIALNPRGAAALLPQEIQGLKNLGINTGVNVGTQAGLNVAQQLQSDAPFSGTELAKAAALGLLFNEPTKLAQRTLKFRPSFEGVPTAGDVIARNREILSRGRPQEEIAEPSMSQLYTPTPTQARIEQITGVTPTESRSPIGSTESAYGLDRLLSGEAYRQELIRRRNATVGIPAGENLPINEGSIATSPEVEVRGEIQKMEKVQKLIAQQQQKEADFARAQAEKQKQDINEAVKKQMEEQRIQEENKRRQLKMAMGVKATPEAITGRTIARPESFDRSKYQEQSAAQKSFDALEPEIDALLAKRGIAKGQYRVTITDASGQPILGTKGLPVAGRAEVSKRVAHFGKEAGADTAFHEAGHIYLDDMARSSNAKDRALVTKAFKEIGRPDLTAEEFVRLNDLEKAGDPNARKSYIDAEEALMDYIGFEGAKRKLGGSKGKQYFKDFLSRFGVGEKPGRQQLAAGLEYDAPRQLSGDEFKPDVKTVAKFSEEEKPEVVRMASSSHKNPLGDPIGTTYRATPEDWAKWQRVQEGMKKVITEGGDFDGPEMMALRRENESIKNKYGGTVPVAPKESLSYAPKEIQEQESVQRERSERSSIGKETETSPSNSLRREEKGKLSEESRAEELTKGMEEQLQTAAMRKAVVASKSQEEFNRRQEEEGLLYSKANQKAQEEASAKSQELEAFTRPDKEVNQETSAFELASEKELRRGTPFDLMLGKDKSLAGNAVLERLPKFLNPAELDALNKAGLKDYLAYKRRTPEELAAWIKEHGPQVEVHSYGMERKTNPLQKERDEIQHWFETKHGNFPDFTFDGEGREPSVVSIFNGKRIVNPDQETLAKAKRFDELGQQLANQSRDTSPRATSAYEQVSALPVNEPMPSWTKSKESKNVQRVDVVVPMSEAGKAIHARGERAHMLWSPDNLHENLPNTLGWAMIQYKTGPNGEHIAFITEAQSRWGQEARKSKEFQEAAASRGFGLSGIAYGEAKKFEHPLLKDYNRLILKAAIDQAQKEGATHIVVSDAETAMMTEGHDLAVIPGGIEVSNRRWTDLPGAIDLARSKHRGFPETVYETNGKIVVKTNDPDWVRFLQKNNVVENIRPDEPIQQEQGMRLNYDQILPKIAEELTGAKGERVELGEHKNAFVQGSAEPMGFGPMEQAEGGFGATRSNLIFKNPDGSPKTTVTGKMFPLEQVAAKLGKEGPFTLHGKKFQESSKITESELRKKPLLNVFTSVTDRIGAGERSKSHVITSKALRNYFDERDFNIGRYGQSWVDQGMNPYKPEDVNAVYKHRWQKDNGLVPIGLTSTQKKINDEWQSIIERPKLDAAKLGLKVKRGETYTVGGIKPEGYLPNQLDPVVLAELENNPSSIEAKSYRRQWAEWLTKKGAKNPEKLIQEWEAARREYGDTGGPEFAALRKPEGYGLPWELMDKNPARAAMRYGRRAAADLAWFKHIQSDDAVRAALGIKDQEGNLPKDVEGIDYIGSEKDVQSALKFVYGKTASEYPRIAAFSKFVGDMIMGPGTAIRNLASIPNNLAAYDVSLRDAFKGLSNIASARKRAIESGAVKLKPEEFERLGDVDNPDKVVALFNKLSNLFRTVQGRNLSDKLEGELYYAIGEQWSKTKILEAQAGDNRAKKLLERVGNITEGSEISSPENIQKLAKGFVNIVRGTYGPQGLPAWALHGNISPFVALSRYSIEKWNNVYKDVGIPMKEGNPLPFFKYALASLGVGVGIEELNKVISGKKGPDLELKEALAVYAKNEDPKVLASKAIGLAQLASFGGIMGDLAKLGTRAAEGKSLTYSNPLSFPAYSFASETVAQNLADALGAMKEGEDPMAVMAEFIKTVSIQSVQAARYIGNRLDSERTARKEEFADLRKFREATGKGTPSEEGRANEFAGLGEKKFKRTSDIREAAAELPELIKNALEKSGKDPYRLKYELRKLKANSYQTMPSPENQPLEFYEYLQYLRDTQGNENAASRLVKFLKQRETNMAKSKLVP